MYFFNEILTFWYIVSKKIHNHSVIIHLVRLLRCETVKIWKIHWKLKYSESQYCFANISAMEARIFMKFYMVVNYYLVGLYLKFHKDLCISACARVVNARTHVLSQVCAFTTHLRALNANISAMEARIFIKFNVVVNYYLVSWSFEFHEDPWINGRERVVNTHNR